MSSLLPEDAPLPAPLVEAWRKDVASDAEVHRAYVRFLQVRPTRRSVPAFQIAGWVLVGMFLGIGGVYAATGAPWKGLWRRPAQPAQPAQAREFTPQRALPKAAPLTHDPPELEEPAPTPSAVPASAPPAARPSPSAAASENWQRAARGLRERDFDSANAALLELEAHGGPAERETAQLVRAQLLLSQGRNADAQLLLGTLRSSARSPAVRQKASALWQRSEESAAPQRSVPTPGATKAP